MLTRKLKHMAILILLFSSETNKEEGRESANAVIICFAHYCIYYGTVARENEYFSRAIYVRIGSFQNDQRKVSLISETIIPIFTQFTMPQTTLK